MTYQFKSIAVSPIVADAVTEYNTLHEAVASMTDDELGNEICRYQRLQMKQSPQSKVWGDISAVLAVHFAEAQKRAKDGAVIRSL